jgi:lipopolysaccharide export LptBFGC system permease protein LptF
MLFDALHVALIALLALSALFTLSLIGFALVLWLAPDRTDRYDELLAEADEAEATVDRTMRDRLAA